jgi:hypothetical protein
MSKNAGFKLAPPTRNPSMSGCFAKSALFFSVTLPPYRMRVFSAASGETSFLSHSRIAAWTSWACSVVATLPVPMALVGVSWLALGREGRIDVPDGLVSDHNLVPVLDLICHSLQLAGNNAHRLIALPLLQSLTTAKDNAQTTFDGGLRLVGDEVVILLQDNATFRVSEDRPCDAGFFELVDADLACEGAVGLVEDVLCGYFEAGAEVLAREEEVEGGWGDDDLCHCISNYSLCTLSHVHHLMRGELS